MNTMAKATISLPDELNDEIEMDLSYGDSKSEWIRQAIRFRQQVDPLLDELLDSGDKEKRVKFVEQAVREKVEEIKNMDDKDWTYDEPEKRRTQ